jgi:hypothetical protein
MHGSFPSVSAILYDVQAGLLPRAIGHALIYNIAFNRLYLLPHELASIFG